MKCNLELPKDRISLNNLIRSYDSLNPIVNNTLSFHSSYPINNFNLFGFKDSDKYFEYLVELELVEPKYQKEWLKAGPNLLSLSREFWRIGEVFPHISSNNFSILHPDAIFLKRDPIDKSIIITLKPDPVLKKLVNSTNPEDEELKKQVPNHILKSIKENDCIPLDQDEVFSILNLQNPYDLRGTSIVLPVLKDLMLFDTLRENLLSTDECANNIFKGLLFSKETLPILLNAYYKYRKQIEKFLIAVLFTANRSFGSCPQIGKIVWPEIDEEKLKEHLK